MAVLQVGAGYSWVKDSSGNRTVFGMLKKSTIEVSVEQKFARGQYQMDMFAANTGIEVKGSFEFEALDMDVLRALGMSQYGANALSVVPVVDDVKSKAASITLTGVTDVLQVVDVNTGNVYKRVASAPVSGVSYTFSGSAIGLNASDTTGSVRVTWLKNAATEQNSLTLSNAMIQQSVYFGIDCIGLFDGKACTGQFDRCVAQKLPFFQSGDDFAKRSVEVRMLANPTNNAIGRISLTEALS